MSSNKKRKINKKNNDPLINYWMHYHDSSLLPNRFVADEKKKKSDEAYKKSTAQFINKLEKFNEFTASYTTYEQITQHDIELISE